MRRENKSIIQETLVHWNLLEKELSIAEVERKPSGAQGENQDSNIKEVKLREKRLARMHMY